MKRTKHGQWHKYLRLSVEVSDIEWYTTEDMEDEYFVKNGISLTDHLTTEFGNFTVNAYISPWEIGNSEVVKQEVTRSVISYSGYMPLKLDYYIYDVEIQERKENES